MTNSLFLWMQGSVYVSKMPIISAEVTNILDELIEENPWLHLCMRDCRETNIGKEHSKIISFNKEFDIPLCAVKERLGKQMKTLQQVKAEQMQDPVFAKEYEAIQPEMDVIRAIVEARTSQNLTQKELAERTGINQADISKLENGTRNPSVNLLKRLAEGMGMTLKIEFVPKKS